MIISALVILSALLSHTMIQNIEPQMSARVTTPFPVKCEHFLLMTDVFTVRQVTLTTDGSYTATLFTVSSAYLSETNNKTINGNTEGIRNIPLSMIQDMGAQ